MASQRSERGSSRDTGTDTVPGTDIVPGTGTDTVAGTGGDNNPPVETPTYLIPRNQLLKWLSVGTRIRHNDAHELKTLTLNIRDANIETLFRWKLSRHDLSRLRTVLRGQDIESWRTSQLSEWLFLNTHPIFKLVLSQFCGRLLAQQLLLENRLFISFLWTQHPSKGEAILDATGAMRSLNMQLLALRQHTSIPLPWSSEDLQNHLTGGSMETLNDLFASMVRLSGPKQLFVIIDRACTTSGMDKVLRKLYDLLLQLRNMDTPVILKVLVTKSHNDLLESNFWRDGVRRVNLE
ncbi:hypothetical protein PFICI_01270 [Pestalotiopsis fici W106-1]|uniref:Uncharacterized protein n=1 Tax=Pestalotiopsis fici (strain W106-1 / CGMCC3.15140) TaxID=1229662 RepID=W3XPJ9_PESFW|nr:uncharacterized protein PFICI_01270 [Pestalotiopsis fici W106-1]ETS87442.1 hypothetical protein PFICI_01270 [Pestalotiopsis fici W106-1]